jgi:hypothetical protein
MSLGKWLTNANYCTLICPIAWAGPDFCPTHSVNYWKFKEKGPPAPSKTYATTTIAEQHGQFGVYEEQPGPYGVFASGFSIPFTLPGTFNWSLKPNFFIQTPITIRTAGVLETGPAKPVEKPCECTSRDMLTFGHKCGRKAPIDRR